MTRDEALRRVDELKGQLGHPIALLTYAEEIERLSMAVLGHGVRRCNCRDRFADALIEIYNYLKTHEEMRSEIKCRLRRGLLLRHDGEFYTSMTITDEVARAYLAEHPENASWFEVLPSPVEADEPTDESADADAASDEPKKAVKKTSKKAKK